jgi:hypothetical protein
MADVSAVIAANREAVNELIAASEQCGAVWTTPRGAGKVVAESDRRTRRAID